MTSQINYAIIDETFPRAGQDNDTETFRRNYASIKDNFRFAKSEIEDLQNNTARTDRESDFNSNVIADAVFRECKDLFYNHQEIIASEYDIDFGLGSYQIVKFKNNTTIQFLGFPENSNSVGKVILELYSDGSERIIRFSPEGSTVLKTNGFSTPKIGETQPLTLPVNASNNPIFVEVWRRNNGIIFIKNLGQFV